jgi:transposase
MEMATSQIVLQDEDTAKQGELYIAFELGDKQWKLSCSDGRRGPSRYSVGAGDKQAVLDCIVKAKARCGLGPTAKVYSCYEAGRDGWWLHRWLLDQGVDNIVVDSASIEVNRRARRAKNDERSPRRRQAAGDAAALPRRRTARVVGAAQLRTPTVQEEDARRVDRELQRLTGERTSHINRIGSLLVLHNLRAGRIGGRDWAAWWKSHAEQVPPALRVEIEREVERLALVKEQMRAIEAVQRKEVASCAHPLVTRLSQLRAIGLISAWKLDMELFGWRTFANRRQLGASLGHGRRFAAAGKRMRRVGIVALARRLAIALWRYLQHGEIPQGATLEPAAA